ncbi:siderophore-interacting protein [Homoserinibacter sp. GY 40078]|uniref:siderophore-interacting protein n=1 Tax=Homoserinibacter sp. GY 40078 TaxID=2603275 RepID=UPI0011CAEE56|nr:siderophore-interacting protein [Homoserinibacter sp. GY 40078]TXK19707.1 siderophore-interacting protein [Homoserinibacter sp. GY 40078]
MSAEALTRPSTEPWIFTRMAVERIEDLTPTFRRFVLRRLDGEPLLADPGFDQRIKVVPPSPQGIDAMPTHHLEWYAAWRAMPEAERPPFRTYTIRGFAGDSLIVDFALHGPDGPAARWAVSASVGDELLVLGPHAEHPGPHGGIDFVPPAECSHHLLAGDETAAPAIARIIEQLPPTARGTAVLELPDAADADYLPAHPGFEVRVLPRDGRPRGEALVEGVCRIATELVEAAPGAEPEEVDVDRDLLWEVPRNARGGAALKSAPLYAWLAGEAGAITAIRRHLVKELGVDRRAVAFMGYWRQGRAENS